VSYVLDSSTPAGLFIPAGFANGSKSLTPKAKILILSTTTLEESKGDDFRLNYDEWNIWDEDFR
jgi:dTDP-4-dehydrorhamnose 3,5-epimerase-like enzyme